jgi:hypothetical protein
MGAHVFLISLYAATGASFLVFGVSILADVSPTGAAIRAGMAFFAFTVLGLVAKAAVGDTREPESVRSGQSIDVVLPEVNDGGAAKAVAQKMPAEKRRERREAGRAAA